MASVMLRLLYIVLLFLSVLNGTAISVFAEPEIFFVSDKVVFLAPIAPNSDLSRSSRGDPVIVLRTFRADSREPGITPGALNEVARGVIFRVRKEYATVKIMQGRPAIGDIVRSGGGTLPIDANFGAGSDERDYADKPAHASGGAGSPAQGILIYKICDAPRVVADQFDRNFSDAFLSQDRIKSDSSTVVFLDASSPGPGAGPSSMAHVPSSGEIISAARKKSSSIVIVPVYVRSPRGDSIEVRVFNGRFGRMTGSTATAIKPFPDLAYTPVGRRVGGLEVIGRFSGIGPGGSGGPGGSEDPIAPGGLVAQEVRFDDAGHILVVVADDVFMLSGNDARFLFPEHSRGGDKKLTLSTSLQDFSIDVQSTGADRQLHRIVISDDNGDPVFASQSYSDLRDLAVFGRRIALLHGSTIELLELHER